MVVLKEIQDLVEVHGGIIRNAQGNLIVAYGKFLGHTTNNMALEVGIA